MKQLIQTGFIAFGAAYWFQLESRIRCGMKFCGVNESFEKYFCLGWNSSAPCSELDKLGLIAFGAASQLIRVANQKRMVTALPVTILFILEKLLSSELEQFF